MATFSRVTTLLIITVSITYYCGSEAQKHGRKKPNETVIFDSQEAFRKSLELGIKMFKKTLDSICWYEQLKAYPFNNHTGRFYSCYSGTVNIASPAIFTCMKLFLSSLNTTGAKSIPDYHSKCQDLLLTRNAIPKVNEGSVLNDGEDEYAFKAYFHCLIHQVREKYGDKVIQIIKTERMDSTKDWMETINDRVNELRSRHGVGALQLNKTLTNNAQKRADFLAETCTFESEKRTTAYIIRDGFCVDGDNPDLSIPAYECVNHWYKEGMDPFPKEVDKLSLEQLEGMGNPYPKGVDEVSFKQLERKGLHKNFAKLVWKGSKSAGYGYASNPDCEAFIVVQFHPVEKKDGEYAETVFLP